MKVLRLLNVIFLFAGMLFFVMSCGSSDSTSDGGGSQCPEAILESKQVDFHNTWQPNVTVQVFEFDLACPDVSFLDPSDIAWSLGSPGYDFDAHLLLPQGRYSVCIDWWDDDESSYLFKIYGDLPDSPLFVLNENTNETVPPQISVSPGYPIDGFGRCPEPIDINGRDDGDSDDDGDSGALGITVQLIGNDDEPAVYNPTPQQIANADITLSGSLNALTINWKLEDVALVAVAGTSGYVYAITGSLYGFGDQYTIDPPVAYGDYSIPDTERAGSPLPAPNLVAGGYYTVTIGTLNEESSYIGFIISN